MKCFILTAAFMGMFALCAQGSLACSCTTLEVPQAFNQARAVFVGEVAEIIKPRTDNLAAPPADRLYTVKFKVEKSWKGAGFQEVTVPEIIVLSDQGRGGCFSWGSFVEGSKYLVYAEETIDGNMAVLFSCNRTASLVTASKDLKELERVSKPSFNRKRSSRKLVARRT